MAMIWLSPNNEFPGPRGGWESCVLPANIEHYVNYLLCFLAVWWATPDDGGYEQ